MGQTITIDLEKIDAGEEGGSLASLIEEAIRSCVGEHVAAEVKEAVAKTAPSVIQESLRPLVEQQINEPIQLYSTYGSPVGPPRPLRDLIIEEFKKMMESRVDSYGRFGSGGEITYIQFLTRQIVDGAFKSHFMPLVEAAKKQFAAEIDGKLKDAIREAGMSTMQAIMGKTR